MTSEHPDMTTLEMLVEAVVSGQEDEAVVHARTVAEEGVPIDEIIAALTVGIREVGEQFARMEIFVPELVLAARTMKAAMVELDPEIQKLATTREKKATVVIGTVEGDMHEIGKDIVVRLLEVQGFEVYDLGPNVNALDFVRKAEEVHADVIGASALMSTTMPGQKDIVDILKEKGIRDKYHVIVGGAPVTPEWVQECGADSWGENAAKAVDILDAIGPQGGI
jgi:corrinoid protein of di/trimethylamine methyltransferase